MIIQVTGQEETQIEEYAHINLSDKNRKLTQKEKFEQIEKLLLMGKCKTSICKSINMDVRVYDKLISMTSD